MTPDTIQFGPWLISKSFVDIMIPLFGALIGTLIGGFISYWATKTVEDRKYQREKKDKLREQQREALAFALEWIDPLIDTISQVLHLTGNYLKDSLDKDAFERDYPNLMASIASLQPPARLKVLLPETTYPRISEIASDLGILKSMALDNWDKNEFIVVLGNTSRKVLELRDDLIKDYRKTFE